MDTLCNGDLDAKFKIECWDAVRTHAQQMWDTFQAGDLPAFMEGVNLTRVEDDGSEEWQALYERAGRHPVHA